MTLMPTIAERGAHPVHEPELRDRLAFLRRSISGSAYWSSSGGHDAGRSDLLQFASWTPPRRADDSDTLGDIDAAKARGISGWPTAWRLYEAGICRATALKQRSGRLSRPVSLYSRQEFCAIRSAGCAA